MSRPSDDAERAGEDRFVCPDTSSARRLKVSTRVIWVLTTGPVGLTYGTAEVAELPDALVAEIERAGAR